MKIISKKIIENNEKIVYDLEVKDNHNYFVEGCLVHNCHKSGHGSSTEKGSKSREAPGTKIRKILDKCKNADWRFGLTGTMPDEKVDYYTIVGGIGPVVIEVKANDLMEAGHVAKLQIVIPYISYKDKDHVKHEIKRYEEEIEQQLKENGKDTDSSTKKYLAERNFIENYLPRYKYIRDIVNSRLEKNENVLLLVNTIAYGKKLKNILSTCKGYSLIEHIHGEVKVDDRKDIRDTMEKQGKCIVIATTSLFSTGISVKRLNTLILVNAGKSKISTIQSVGRTLRLSCDKDIATVIDIVDDLNYTAKHSVQRLEYYDQESYDYTIIDTII